VAIASKSASFRRCYGKEFTDRLFGLRKRAATGQHEFDTLCSTLSIEHRLPPPRSPQTNGMVERFNGRIEEVLQSHHFRSSDELGATLHRYVWLYNHQLPQSALGSKTPLQAMKQWHKIKPNCLRNSRTTSLDVTANKIIGNARRMNISIWARSGGRPSQNSIARVPSYCKSVNCWCKSAIRLVWKGK
jgi:hypothetical protein